MDAQAHGRAWSGTGEVVRPTGLVDDGQSTFVYDTGKDLSEQHVVTPAITSANGSPNYIFDAKG